MKFAFVARHRPVWPTRMMCRLLGVSTSGFYEWLDRAPSARSVANAGLLVRIRESFALSQQTYGSPRVWKDLVVWGEGALDPGALDDPGTREAVADAIASVGAPTLAGAVTRDSFEERLGSPPPGP